MKYLISYDLISPGQDYSAIYEKLNEFKAKKVLESQWVFRRINTNAENLRDYFRKFIDENDRLLIVCLDNNNWSGWNLINKISEM